MEPRPLLNNASGSYTIAVGACALLHNNLTESSNNAFGQRRAFHKIVTP